MSFFYDQWEKKRTLHAIFIYAPDGDRTHDFQLRRLTLYPTELRGHI